MNWPNIKSHALRPPWVSSNDDGNVPHLSRVASLGSILPLGCVAALLGWVPESADTPVAASTTSGPTLTEVRRLDGTELELVPIGDAVIAPDGAIVFTQPMDNGVLIYPRRGEPVFRGGNGRGPGEFAGVDGLSWREDSLVVHDLAQGRLTLLSPGSYEAARTVRYPTTITLESGVGDQAQSFSLIRPMALTAGDSVLAELRTATGSPTFEDRIILARVGPDAVARRVLASTPNRGFAGLPNGGTMALPFANLVHRAVSPAGAWIAIAATDYSGEAATGILRIALIDAQSGDTVLVAQRTITLDRITGEYARSFLARHTETLAERSPEMAEVLEREGLPDYFPPLHWLIVTDQGHAYLEVRSSGDERRYIVFAPDGPFIGELRVPEYGRIHAAVGRRILTITKNELDVPSLVEYEVSWD